jgi:hypothetical protein
LGDFSFKHPSLQSEISERGADSERCAGRNHMSSSAAKINYAELFAAIGRFIAKEQMQNVCVMEFEGGMVVSGSVFYEHSHELNRRVKTHVLSKEDLQRLIRSR